MKSAVVRSILGMALLSGLPMPALFAEGGTKALPTLLIKGEVVSLDTNDPSAILLKVKDRYGFETPIFLTEETTVTQGEATGSISSLSAGIPVEVEYNFDVNTATRHAVSVKVAVPTPPAEAASAPASAPALPAPAIQPTEPPVASEVPADVPVSQPASEAPSATP